MAQILANALSGAAVIALVGIGFGLVYRVAGFFHFAHGLIISSGAFVTYVLYAVADLWLVVAFVLGIISAAILGVSLEICLYHPLRRTGTSPLGMFLGSLAAYSVGQNVLSVIFGDAVRVMKPGHLYPAIEFAGIRYTVLQVSTIIIGFTAVGLTALWIGRSRLGLLLRCVGDAPELAESTGLPIRKALLAAMFIGSVLAGLAGSLVALDTGLAPTMGMQLLLPGIVAVVISGSGSLGHLTIGAVVISAAQHLGMIWLPGSWQDTIVFGILILLLVVRPQGMINTLRPQV